MAAINASTIKLEIGVDPVAPATEITVWKGIAEETSCSFNISVAEIPTTSEYNDGFDEAIPGLITGTLSGEAIVNNAANATRYTPDQIQGMILARNIKTFRIGAPDTSEPRDIFKGFFTSFEFSAAMEDTAKYTFEIKMTTKPVPAA